MSQYYVSFHLHTSQYSLIFRSTIHPLPLFFVYNFSGYSPLFFHIKKTKSLSKKIFFLFLLELWYVYKLT